MCNLLITRVNIQLCIRIMHIIIRILNYLLPYRLKIKENYLNRVYYTYSI